jgi:hypothetical protein
MPICHMTTVDIHYEIFDNVPQKQTSQLISYNMSTGVKHSRITVTNYPVLEQAQSKLWI